MIFGILTLITALCISAVAIYYSVAGLMTIFAAAAIPIMIMGGVLEIGKLVTAVWLHKYWKQATWWLKTYLTTAVAILMFITSMGIFGFLSKAHIEQTASAGEGVAQLERIEAEINRNEQIIVRAESKIEELETDGTGATNQLQTQIDREQERIAGAYDRIQPAIQEQNQIIAGVTALFQTELDRIDQELATLQGYIDAGDIRKAQAMVGARADGAFGPATARAFTAWQESKRAERNEWLQKIQDAAQSPTVIAAREEIARLRAGADEQIAESNALINNLRNQLKSNDGNDLQAMLDEQNERVRTASSEVDVLFEQKFQLEAEYRKLEAEVGPIKYIAEFVYGESADTNMLEEAVRWVIIIIIFVFDPLAVLLLIAAQYTFEFRKKELEDDRGERLRLERAEYERARAQRIVDNPGVTFDGPVPTGDSSQDEISNDSEEKEDEHRKEDREEKQQDAGELRNGQDEQSVEQVQRDNSVELEIAQEERPVDVTGGHVEEAVQRSEHRTSNSRGNAADRMAMAGNGELDDNSTNDETVNTNKHATMGEASTTELVSDDVEAGHGVEQSQVQHDGLTADEHAKDYADIDNIEKKESDIKSLEELKREAEYELKEQDETFQINKTTWKEANPNLTLKHYKNLYVQGMIDSLPWETPPQDDNYKAQEGYQQNAEQNENTLFNKLSNK